MLHELLILLAMQPSILTAIHTVHRIRPLRHPVVYCSLTLATMDLLWFFNQCILSKPNTSLSFIILFAGFLYLPFFTTRGHKLHALLAHALTMTLSLVVIIITERISVAISPWLHLDARRLLDMQDPLYFLVITQNACVLIPLLLLFSRYMQKQRISSPGSFRLLWFFVIPFSQAALLIMVNQYLTFDSSPGLWLFLLFGTFFCVAADFACILAYRKYHQYQMMADQVRQAEQQLATQNEYYHEMQDSILRINQIRHDLNNQLKTAYYLLEHGHPDEVRKQLDTLENCLQDRVGTKFCENLMVDAVLREKAAQCQSHNIPIEFYALVPADLKLDCAHLCSTFSNLLDNSIAAALKAGPGSGPILLKSDISRGYLAISCSNPSVPPQQERKEDILRRHGLGLEILGRLARLHDGHFEAHYQDGRFYVKMLLKNA